MANSSRAVLIRSPECSSLMVHKFSPPSLPEQSGTSPSPPLSNSRNPTSSANSSAPKLHHPKGICFDSHANLYVADFGASVIRRIAADGDGTPQVWCGLAGTRGSQDGIGRDARFNNPLGITADARNNIYVVDFSNQTVRVVSPSAQVSTVCGQPGAPGYRDGFGSEARFNFPRGIACDQAMDVLYICDTENQLIRKVNIATTLVTTLCGFPGLTGFVDGQGLMARLHSPAWAAVDWDNVIYISDNDNNAIRRVTPSGNVTTLCGKAGQEELEPFSDGDGTRARFYNPRGSFIDLNGTIILPDYGNHCVRRIDNVILDDRPPVDILHEKALNRQSPSFSPAQVQVRTWVGSPSTVGSKDGAGDVALFNAPVCAALHPFTGEVYVADEENHDVRRISGLTLIPWTFACTHTALRLLRISRLLRCFRNLCSFGTSDGPRVNTAIRYNPRRALVSLLVMHVVRADYLSSSQMESLLVFTFDRGTLGTLSKRQFLKMIFQNPGPRISHPDSKKRKLNQS